MGDMSMKRKALWLRWMDSGSTPGWGDEESLKEEALVCESIGWLVKENKNVIVLALNASFDEYSRYPFGDAISIPKGCILSRKVINELPPKT